MSSQQVEAQFLSLIARAEALEAPVQSMTAQLATLQMTEERVTGLIHTGTTSLRNDFTALQTDNGVLHAQYAHFVSTPPNVIHVEAPQRTGGDNSNKRTRSIMDTKGFTKLEVFKGVGWNRWKNQFITLARLAYPDAGLECLEGAAKAKYEIHNAHLLV